MALLASSLVAAALMGDYAVAQTFISQGPGPGFGLANTIGSADQSPNGTDAGAIQAILPDPELGANTLFAGSPNGGVFISTDFGATWKALTDNQASLSISSLALDPTDPSGKTIIAGIGVTDNGEYSQFNVSNGRGGALTGLLYTNNGGVSWSTISSPLFANESVVDADVRGSTILAATYEVQDPTGPTGTYGLFRSTDGGTTFSRISGGIGTGLPNGAVTSLVADPSNPSRFYAAIQQSANNNATAVYVSNDSGASWSLVFNHNNTTLISTGSATTITLAAGPNGSVAIALSNLATSSLTGVFLSGNQGQSWNQITAAPNVVAGGQTPVNLHIAIDPTNSNIVYLTGDRYNSCGNNTGLCSVQAYRLNFNPSNDSSTATSLTTQGTAPTFLDAMTVHADSRAIAFDASGNMILASDGGIYLKTDPQGNGVTWQGLNGNLSAFEGYFVAYDANSKRVAIAAQDTGTFLQSAPGSSLFNSINGGDGTNVAINDKTLSGMSAIYTSAADLAGPTRLIINSQGQVVGPTQYDPVNNPGGIYITCNGGLDCAHQVGGANTFSSLFILNRIDPTYIAISGKTDVFLTRDTLTGTQGIDATSLDLQLTDLGATNAPPSAISYGTRDNTQALVAGSSVSPSSVLGQVWFSGNGTSLTQLTQYAGNTPTSVVFDTNSQNHIYVADALGLYSSTNATGGAGATFNTLTADLPAGFTRPTSVEFVSSNGVNALLVGGLNTPLTCTSAPNGCVIAPTQSPITVADADTNGNLSGWRAFGNSLPNALIYQMTYNAAVDVLAVSSIGRGAWVMYDVTSNFATASVLQFGLADNDSNPDASLLTDGTVGSRPLIKYGTGTLTITGDATYTGSTTVENGTLDVDGTISGTSNVMVDAGGTLTGTGAVDPIVVTIASGATFAPGAAGVPGTSMTIDGNLAFQSGAYYAIQLNGTSSNFAIVTGTASLDGTVLATFMPGAVPKHQYTILTSAGLNDTMFAGLSVGYEPAGFNASLAYTADDVLLDMTAMLGAGAGLNGNQQSAANAINAFFNNGGALTTAFANLFDLSNAGLQTALTQIDGEDATGAEHGAFDLMNEFLGLMLDPFIDGRGSSPTGNGALGFAPDQADSLPPDIALAYAGLLKAPSKPAFAQHWSTWASAFGGSATANGDPTVGSNNVTTSTYGYVAGMDYRYSPDTVFGFSLAGGGTNWNLANALGTGRSDAFLAGVYGVTHNGPWYLGGALAFGNNWFTTNRIALGDTLTASFQGQSYSGRLEGGYRFAVPVYHGAGGVTPYAAIQAQDFHTPAYSETDVTGGGFGLSYNAMNGTDTRSELGGRFDDVTAINNLPLVLRAKLAWAHDWVSNPALNASFESLPGTAFTVNGAAIPHDTALTSIGGQLFFTPNWSFLTKFDGEFAGGYQLYAGSGTLRYTW